jgi:hypothetical protein
MSMKTIVRLLARHAMTGRYISWHISSLVVCVFFSCQLLLVHQADDGDFTDEVAATVTSPSAAKQRVASPVFHFARAMTPGGTTDPAHFLPSSPAPRVASPPPTIRPRPHSSGGHRGGANKSGSSAPTSPIHMRAASNGASAAAAASGVLAGDGSNPSEIALALPSDEVLHQQEVQAKHVQAVGVRKPNQACLGCDIYITDNCDYLNSSVRNVFPSFPSCKM